MCVWWEQTQIVVHQIDRFLESTHAVHFCRRHERIELLFGSREREAALVGHRGMGIFHTQMKEEIKHAFTQRKETTFERNISKSCASREFKNTATPRCFQRFSRFFISPFSLLVSSPLISSIIIITIVSVFCSCVSFFEIPFFFLSF